MNGLDSWNVTGAFSRMVDWKSNETLCEVLKRQKFITSDILKHGEPDSDDEDEDEDGDFGGLTKEEAAAKKEKKMKEQAAKDEQNKIKTNREIAEANPGLASKNLDDATAVKVGSYVRICLEGVPASSLPGMDVNRRPLVVGGLLPGELKMAQLRLRVKLHRWAPKILKSHDPVLCSMGWRRFQTVPMYALEDRNEKRLKFLKYTPEHMHCQMLFYGPQVPPKTGAIFIRNWHEQLKNYRISATGLVLDTTTGLTSGTGAATTSGTGAGAVKKLKLTGEPYKIFKNTAFIKGMFTSDLEVSKALHAKIQTVSGIRGEIKKAEGNTGNFRATFEDKLLMSDIVMCKTWVDVKPKEFYNPMLDTADWRRMKTIGELRYENSLEVPQQKDSSYGQAQQTRGKRKFTALKLPKALEMNLPIKSMPKNDKPKNKARSATSEAINKETTSRVGIMSEEEHARNSFITRLNTVQHERKRSEHAKTAKKWDDKNKRAAYIQAKRDVHTAEAKKRGYVKTGMEEERKRKKMRLKDD